MEYIYKTEFIERTQKLLEQYDKYVPLDNKHYEVTLLLNACVGLLFVFNTPKYRSKLPSDNVKHLEDIKNCITKCRKLDKGTLIDESKTVQSICRHIRNSIAHCIFETKSSNNIIDTILFKDYIGDSDAVKKRTFKAEIKVETLREFLIDLSSQTLNNIKQKNDTDKM